MQASTSSQCAMQRLGCQRGAPPAARSGSGANGVLSRRRPGRAAPTITRASIVSRSTLPEEFSEARGFHLSFVAFSRLAPERKLEQLQQHLPEHETWLRGLGDRLVLHGPFLNAEAQAYGSEMYCVRAESAALARQLVETDPLHTQGIRKFELMSWVQQTQW